MNRGPGRKEHRLSSDEISVNTLSCASCLTVLKLSRRWSTCDSSNQGVWISCKQTGMKFYVNLYAPQQGSLAKSTKRRPKKIYMKSTIKCQTRKYMS
ncbi:hypothetical protein BO78DRAFT_104737 [Aspergillus sclerotiicarbonarius CBS 121057]|uniref:Uncharacterized protein n=1 Tax=Aspergillus sclerotiicarbonarius (strain CBS 121057 / IBT 28362) TaxID=1448318 RepID=A0A319EAH9_ASPSB|nr:hypothetical protein BO78DRAFT_104737 [Aspergillus sclerotiicarbonarius CBS 121057]